MKAISVKQPWAILLVEGHKKLEVRSWSTKHRGPLLICASKSPNNVFWESMQDGQKRLMHAGCMIGVVNLKNVRKMEKPDEEDAMCDFYPGAYVWEVEPIHYVEPKKVNGKLQLFEVLDENIRAIGNNEEEWIFDYPTPQGNIKFSEKTCSIFT